MDLFAKQNQEAAQSKFKFFSSNLIVNLTRPDLKRFKAPAALYEVVSEKQTNKGSQFSMTTDAQGVKILLTYTANDSGLVIIEAETADGGKMLGTVKVELKSI